MKREIFSPRQALNKAFLRVKPNLCQVEKFPTHPQTTLGEQGRCILTYKNDDRAVQSIGKWER